MQSLQVTITATGVPQPLTPIQLKGIANGIYFQQLFLQNNGSNNMRIGDSSVSTTKGILLYPGGSQTGAMAIEYSGTLNDWYVVGTAGDVLDIMVIQ
jgi:hypothetical protein